MKMFAAAVCGWVSAMTLLIVGTVYESMDLFAWSIMLATIACVPTGILIVQDGFRRERERSDALLEAVTEKLISANVTNIRRVK